MGTHGQTDTTKLIVGIRNFATAPENYQKKSDSCGDINVPVYGALDLLADSFLEREILRP